MKIFIINIIDANLELYSLKGICSSYLEANLSETFMRQIQDIKNEIYDEVKFTLENDNINELLLDFNRNEFLSDNHLSNYFFTLKGKASGQIHINNVYRKDEDEIKNSYSFNESQMINLKEGDILSKIIAHNIIQKRKVNNAEIKKLSEKYKILCKYTILSGEEEELFKDDNNNLNDNHCFIGKKKDKPIDDDNSDLLSKVISSQSFKGSWNENEYTKKIIEIKKDVYNKVNECYKNQKVAITFTILNYIKDDVDKIYPYSEEIEKAESYLVKKNASYDIIQQNLFEKNI